MGFPAEHSYSPTGHSYLKLRLFFLHIVRILTGGLLLLFGSSLNVPSWRFATVILLVQWISWISFLNESCLDVIMGICGRMFEADSCQHHCFYHSDGPSLADDRGGSQARL
jgi:hypothetical protein